MDDDRGEFPAEPVYVEDFAAGTGGWKVALDREDGSYNRNVLGKRGEGVPLGWAATGGPTGPYAYSESPWYFDSNHGEFMWFYMPLIGPQGESWSARTRDLRNGVLRITLRGRRLRLEGCRLYLWIQGQRGPHVRTQYNPGDPMVNWALTSQPIEQPLLDGGWHDVALRLADDENLWSQMGLLNRGLPRKIVVEQSLTFATGTLGHLLDGHHHNIGFLLGGVDPHTPPEGRIEVARIALWTR